MENKVHMNISIFYAEKVWHEILDEAIWPLIDNTKELDGYCLVLGRQRGDHLKLTLRTEKSNARSLAQKADVHLRKFLKDCPSTSTRSLVPKVGYYMDFRNNSIHYGLFENLVKRGPTGVHDIYLQEVTRVLFHIFQCYGPDTIDDLVEIMIQLFTIFCNETHLDNRAAATLFDFMLEIEYKKYKNKALIEIMKVSKDNFVANKDPILEYLNNHRKIDFCQYDEKWQSSWGHAIKKCCASLPKTIEQDKINKEYTYMIDSLCDTFDFKDRISAYYLFSNAMKSLNF